MFKYNRKKGKCQARVLRRNNKGKIGKLVSTHKLIIEKTPVGLYQARYSMRGQVPDELKGLFTRKDRILTIAKQRGIEVEETV